MKLLIGTFFLAFVLLGGCSTGTSVDIEETAQQVGDIMASIDESGGTNGVLGGREAEVLNRRVPETLFAKTASYLLPLAHATSCASASTFGACSSNVITRTFGDCTIGGAVFSGTVTLTWGAPATSCVMTGSGATVTRNPGFVVTGRRGATLTVSKTGTLGQRMTWASGTGTNKVFNFSNDGIRRVFTANGSTLFDFTTATTSDITVTGTLRSNRVVNGGNLRVTNNLSSVTCDYVPSSVTWSSTCNCAVSGSWTGTCSDGKASDVSITGCGAATFTMGSESQMFTFDRCYGI